MYVYIYTVHVWESRTSNRKIMFGKFRKGNPCLFDNGNKTITSIAIHTLLSKLRVDVQTRRFSAVAEFLTVLSLSKR